VAVQGAIPPAFESYSAPAHPGNHELARSLPRQLLGICESSLPPARNLDSVTAERRKSELGKPDLQTSDISGKTSQSALCGTAKRSGKAQFLKVRAFNFEVEKLGMFLG
jgi:hypothetical protein